MNFSEEEKSIRLAKFVEILTEARRMNCTDIHFAPACPVMFRVDGDLIPYKDSFESEEVSNLLEVMLTEDQMAVLDDMGELDFAYSIKGFSRLRLNVFRQRGTYAMAIRILSYEAPTCEELGLPASVIDIIHKKRGLFLVTGATGSGKSTTLASLVSRISKTYSKTIITLEDPIEYLHKHGKSVVLQREIGYDTKSYANALRAALRQDPDVILVGEMRDLETITTAITAAETGHLVFSTLHTNSAASTIDRIIDVFPPYQQQQIRVQLASVLEGVVAQQLLPMKTTNGRKAAFEVMLKTPAIQNLIREGKAFQIPTVMQTGKKEGMITMDDAIYELYMKGEISSETAMTFAHDPSSMMSKINIF